jgi:hypothetical protein
MLRRLFGLVVLLMTLWSATSSALAGIDETYIKPAGKKIWGEILADFMGHRGFGKSYALVVGISRFDDFSSCPRRTTRFGCVTTCLMRRVSTTCTC